MTDREIKAGIAILASFLVGGLFGAYSATWWAVRDILHRDRLERLAAGAVEDMRAAHGALAVGNSHQEEFRVKFSRCMGENASLKRRDWEKKYGKVREQ